MNRRALNSCTVIVTIVASVTTNASFHGAWASQDASAWQCAAGTTSKAAPRKPVVRRALVIANGEYHDRARFKHLPEAVPDGQLLADTLRQVGFRVETGTALTNLDLTQMRSVINKYILSVAPGELALFFYGGHALQVDGRSYLAPVDADISRAQDVLDQAIPLEQAILEPLSPSRGRVVVVILDACRESPFPDTAAGLARPVAPLRNAAILFSSAPGFSSVDNSGFTRSLTAHISEPGARIEDVFARVRRDVIAKTASTQRPAEYGTLEEEVRLVDPIQVQLALEGADDDAKVILNGTELFSWQTRQTEPMCVSLSSGEHHLEVKVYNQRSYTGGLPGLGGRLPEGWRYSLSVSQAGKQLAKISDREDRPEDAGARHGKEFLAGRIRLQVDKVSRQVKVVEATSKVNQ